MELTSEDDLYIDDIIKYIGHINDSKSKANPFTDSSYQRPELRTRRFRGQTALGDHCKYTARSIVM